MSVNGVNNAQRSDQPLPKPTQPKQNNNDDGMTNMFMKLLVAQVQNQNPLNPTDGTEYVAQLAQMAQVKSMENMSLVMQNNAVLMDNLQVLSTASLIDQDVMVQTDEINLAAHTIKGRLTLESPAENITVILKDSAGVQHKIELVKQDKGQINFEIEPGKLGLEPGKYTISVVTKEGNKESNSAIPVEIAGKVTNVRIPVEGGGMLISLGEVGEVPFHKLSQIGSKQLAQNKRV